MVLLDVNVLVYAYRRESPQHRDYRALLEALVNGPQAYGMSDLVLSGFLRIVTHPRVFARPDGLPDALRFVTLLREPAHCVMVRPGARHWAIFTDLCQQTQVRGNLVADAYLAALAIEHGCEWLTSDHDYARFPGLTWRHPLRAVRP